MVSAIAVGFGGPPALRSCFTSRKYSGPITPGLMTVSCFAGTVPLFAQRSVAPRGMHRACPGPHLDIGVIDGPGECTFQAIDHLFVTVIAVCRARHSKAGRHRELK